MKRSKQPSQKTHSNKNIPSSTSGNNSDTIATTARRVKRPRMAGLSWSDEKRELLKELWSSYRIGDYSREDMERIFCSNIQTICAYVKHLKLDTEYLDNKIDYDYLKEMKIKTTII